MSKKIKFDMMLEVPAGQVTAGPPIATTLGPKGVPLGLFAKAVNDLTNSYIKGATVRLRVKIFDDKSYDVKVMGYSTRNMIFRAISATKGSATPGHNTIATIDQATLTTLAQEKFPGMDLEAAIKTLTGTARSMGVKVV